MMKLIDSWFFVVVFLDVGDSFDYIVIDWWVLGSFGVSGGRSR